MRSFILVTLLVVCILLTVGCAAPALPAQTAGDLTVGMAVEPTPPLVDRPVTVELRVTRGGAPLHGARVTMHQVMPGMEHEDGGGQAVAEDLGGGRYRLVTTFAMGGAWELQVRVDDGEPLAFRLEVEQP